MANIDKQMIAKLPVKDFDEFILDYKNGWCIPVKKIWSNKEVERFTFKLANDEGLFECGPKLATELSHRVGLMLKYSCTDIKKITDIRVVIARSDKHPTGFCISMYTDELPKRSALYRMWFSIKKVFV